MSATTWTTRCPKCNSCLSQNKAGKLCAHCQAEADDIPPGSITITVPIPPLVIEITLAEALAEPAAQAELRAMMGEKPKSVFLTGLSMAPAPPASVPAGERTVPLKDACQVLAAHRAENDEVKQQLDSLLTALRAPGLPEGADAVEWVRDQLGELDILRGLFDHALKCVDRVFQVDSTDFCNAGDDKFEAVVKLAEAYTAAEARAREAEGELERWANVSSERNHGASGLCCQLRLQEKQRADAAQARIAELEGERSAMTKLPQCICLGGYAVLEVVARCPLHAAAALVEQVKQPKGDE
jgi:hypothetical protein